jgi:gamma-glutamyltranspeptidase
MPNNCAPWLWVVQTQSTDGWQTTIVPGHVGAYDLALKPGGHLPLQVAVTAVNRLALASPVKLLGPEGQ